MLRRYVQSAANDVEERCEFCAEPITAEHRHLIEVPTRQIICVCRSCSILFDKKAASRGKYRRIPDRRLYLEDFRLSDAQWESLRIPVGMAFIYFSTPAERVVAYYPSPMGAVESLLAMDTWREIEANNPVLATIEPDVEALLVNRARGARQHFLVPIDDCYRLVGLIRVNWKGLSGGHEVWQEIAAFFAHLQERAKPAAMESA
jgi:hypothetical protein